MVRRDIFSTNTQSDASNIPPVSIAGPNESINLLTAAYLDGSGSYDIDGTISTYLWTQVTAFAGVSITTPNASQTFVEGLTTSDVDYVFRLTVTDNDGATDSDDVTIKTSSDPSANDLTINATTPDGFGSGTLDFEFGEPKETIDLLFTLVSASSGDSIQFSGANIGVLDYAHPVRTGSVILNPDGTLSKNYSSTGDTFSCVIEITGRSSLLPLPTPKSTLITL